VCLCDSTPADTISQHLTSYPVVSDGIKTYSSHPYGQKSITLTNDLYSKFVRPWTPYFATPYSIVAPYLAKADSLGEKGLSELDKRVPMIRSETSELKSKGKEYASWPYNYLLSTWEDEYKKTSGEGYVKKVKAVVSTELKVTLDAYHFLLAFLIAKKEEGKKVVNEKAN